MANTFSTPINTRTGPGIRFTWGFSILAGDGNGTFQALPSSSTRRSRREFNDPQLASVSVQGNSELAVATLAPRPRDRPRCRRSRAAAGGPVLTGTYPIFTAPPSVNPSSPVDPAPQSETVGDFNGDGRADLAISGALQGSILLGNADGTFQAALNPPNLAGPVIAADFNGDGKSDLAVIGSDLVTVFTSVGDGSFQTGMSYGAGQPVPTADQVDTPPTYGAAVGDFNGDAHADLAVVAPVGLEVTAGTRQQHTPGGPGLPLGRAEGRR